MKRTITRYVWAPDYITAATQLTRGYSYFTEEEAHADNLNCRTERDTLFRFEIASAHLVSAEPTT